MRVIKFCIFISCVSVAGKVDAQAISSKQDSLSIHFQCFSKTGEGKTEALPFTVLWCVEQEKSVQSNEEGFASFVLPKGTFTVVVSHVGFQTDTLEVVLDEQKTVKVFLESLAMETVLIEGDKDQLDAVDKSQLSVEKVSMREAQSTVAFLGEVDIVRTMQLKPGIASGGEGITGLYVRGGAPDQNLFLYDGAVLYNPSHLFGFFSIFNQEAVSEVELYKSSFPAEFGGRLSSVVEVSSKDGNRDSLEITGGIGILASRGSISGPIVKGKGSYLLTGRRTYFDAFTRIINRVNADDPDYRAIPSYFFYDMNGKAEYQLNEKQTLSLSGYYGRDNFSFTDRLFKFRFRWGNAAVILTHDYLLNERWKLSNSLYFSNYQYRTVIDNYGLQVLTIGAGIYDGGWKGKAIRVVDENTFLTFGAEAAYNLFDVGSVSVESSSQPKRDKRINFIEASQQSAFAGLERTWNKRWKAMGGLRLSSFLSDGELMGGLEPRISGQGEVWNNFVLKAGYARMYQYVHLASNSGASLPTDIWYPSTSTVRPQLSDQLTFGADYYFGNDRMFKFSNEYYYKRMERLIDFRTGADLLSTQNLDAEFTFGKGWAYGMEVYLEKKKGKLKGWVGYTLAWAWREFPEINQGQLFHPRYDRRHDVSMVVMYALGKNWELQGTWVFGTGSLLTLPTNFFAHQDVVGTTDLPPAIELIPIYGNRNNYRLRPYHRMDIGLSRKFQTKRGVNELSFGLFNAYNRRNPFFIYFDQIRENEDTNDGLILGLQPKEVSLFPILPSVTYSFKFR